MNTELHNEVTRSNLRNILEKHTRENPELLNSSKGKDIVVFLGKTGAGKSTLINYLNDKELNVDENDNIVLKNLMDSSAMRIGIGGESETFLPKFIKSNGLLFYDLAGFGDTRGTAISLVNACFIKNIIENAATARLIFVAGQDEITAGRGELLKQLTMITKDLIPNETIERLSSLVITKSTPGRNKQQLITFLQTKTNPEILSPWIKQGRLAQMHSPFSKEIDLKDKTDILDAIFNTPSQKIQNINIGTIYNDKEMKNLCKVYCEEIDDVTHRLIKDKFESTTLSSLDIGTLENKRQYFQFNFLKDVRLSLNMSPLITLLSPVSDDIYHSSWDDMKENISLASDKLIALIDIEIKERQKKEIEKRCLEEEQRRIRAEIDMQRILLEKARAEESMREQLRQAEVKSKQIEEENKRLQAEKKHMEMQRIQLEKARAEELIHEQLRQAEAKSSNGLNTGICPSYITGLIALYGRNSHPPNGYTLINQDLNQGAKGEYIYLCYSRNPFCLPIRAITVVSVSGDDDITWKIAPTSGYNPVRINGTGDILNTNRGTGRRTNNISLWYSELERDGYPILEIDVIAGDNGDITKLGWKKINSDLNKKAGGKYIYIVYRD